MQLSRRETIALGLGAAVLTVLPFRAQASIADRINDFTGGADVVDGGVTLTAPEIAENGGAVPITVDAIGASAIVIFAAGNPLPLIATFNFGPLAASREVSTRIRLAGSQDVVAIARMADGTYARAAKTVQVTIGGC